MKEEVRKRCTVIRLNSSRISFVNNTMLVCNSSQGIKSAVETALLRDSNPLALVNLLDTSLSSALHS